MLYYLILGVVAIGALVLQEWLHMRERKSLLDRVMARDYEQYEYFQQQFKGEVEELKNQREDAREEKSEDDEIKKEMDLEYEKEKEFIEGTEEDWDENEVDLEKLRERIGKK